MPVRPFRGAVADPILHAVGARPNFVKMAPLIEALDRRGVADQVVVHTGQHYDRRMSEEILEDLGFPVPDYSLGVGSGSHGEQTGKVLIAFEEIAMSIKPAVVVVAGDVNSTLACALAASKLGIPVVHLEAGLRSGDWTMPEDINRVLTDRLSDLLLTHSPEAEEHLAREGVDMGRVRFVGNTMIDSLRRFEAVARDRAAWSRHDVQEREYVLVTLHRPSNVDDPARLAAIVNGLCTLAAEAPILFPVHRARDHGWWLGAPSSASNKPGSAAWIPPATWISCRCRRAPEPSSPIPVGSRKKRPRWASRATRYVRTLSDRSRSAAAPTLCSGMTPSV